MSPLVALIVLREWERSRTTVPEAVLYHLLLCGLKL